MSAALVLGDFSGNNLGHNALALAIVSQLAEAGWQSVVPSLGAARLRHVLRPEPSAEVLDVGPLRMCVKFLGWPVVGKLRTVDRVVLADNLFYDRALWNPVKNNLFALVLLCRLARRLGKPVVYFNSGVGPLATDLGRRLARHIAGATDPLIVRDEESRALLAQLAPGRPIVQAADSGFDIPWERFSHSGGGRLRWLGVNLSAQAMRELSSKAPTDRGFVSRLAGALSSVARKRGLGLAFVVAHRGDAGITEAIRRRVDPDLEVLVLRELGTDFSLVAQQVRTMEAVVGSRYHELVMYASAGVPVVGLEAGDKVGPLMEQLGTFECCVSSDVLLGRRMMPALAEAAEAAAEARARLVSRVEALRRQARHGVQEALAAKSVSVRRRAM